MMYIWLVKIKKLTPPPKLHGEAISDSVLGLFLASVGGTPGSSKTIMCVRVCVCVWCVCVWAGGGLVCMCVYVCARCRVFWGGQKVPKFWVCIGEGSKSTVIYRVFWRGARKYCNLSCFLGGFWCVCVCMCVRVVVFSGGVRKYQNFECVLGWGQKVP